MKKRFRYIHSVFLILLSALLFTSATLADLPEIQVVANEIGAPSSITFKDLQAIFKGEKQRWDDGTKISVAFMKTTTPVGSATASKVMNMTSDQLNKFWLALVFQGKAKAPLFFSTALELENYLSSTPGAIGIVEGSYKTTIVRSILVDGKKTL